MKIEGIHIEQQKGLTAIFVEKFSKELQGIIRDQLTGIFHGYAEINELPTFYSYPFTLKSFLDRYDPKSDEIKKGMIGELLAHVLINTLFDQLSCLSVLKNKEERSIRKGFDIIYYHKQLKSLWYTEVKSGRSENGSATSDQYNRVLLSRSKNGIIEIFNSKRSSLWESAIIDVKLVVEEGSRRLNMRELLAKDQPANPRLNPKKNVILISVLYHDMADRMSMNQVVAFEKQVLAENVFKDFLILSIQKGTYERVAKFLKTESLKK